MFYTIGKALTFNYNGKTRCVKIEKIKKSWSPLLGYFTYSITGWDSTADAPTGGYRTFIVHKMSMIETVA